MLEKLNNLMHSFLPCQMRRQVRELYASTIILNFAVAMVSIFEPVFIFLFFMQRYGLRESLIGVLVFYLAVYVVYVAVLPLGAKFARRFGYEYSIALGTVFTALFYFCLFGINYHPWLLAPAVGLYVLWKMFYWPAFHANFSKFEVDGECGREVGGIVVLQSLVSIVGPLLGGLLISFLGFKSLFILLAIIMVLSNVPMLMTKEAFAPAQFSYREAYRRLFSKENRRRFFALWGYGEEIIGLTVWPIFMYLVVKDFLQLGVLVAIGTFATTAVFLYIGKLADRTDPRKIIRFGALLYFFGWLFRLLSRNVLGVFLVDTYSRITKQVVAVPLTAQVYKDSHKEPEMEGIVSFELSLLFGKAFVLVAAIAILLIFGLSWSALFVLAAAMGLLYLLF